MVACLTMTEFNLFRNIRLREFLDKTWLTEQMSSLVYVMVSSPPLVDECPYPCSLLFLTSAWYFEYKVNRFNFVAFWVATEICSTPVLATRRTVLERFITIADVCLSCQPLLPPSFGCSWMLTTCAPSRGAGK